MGRLCTKVVSIIGCCIHILWATALLTLTGILQSDTSYKNIGFVPTVYDLVFLWIYDVSLFVTGICILSGIIWKKQKLVSWMILLFLLIQAFAFGVAVAMLTLDRFKGTSFNPQVEGLMFHASPQLVVSIIAGFHCIGSFIYILILIACVHKLNEKFSPYWK